jgi:hypothetical protein
MIRADGRAENKGKPRENILTASLSVRKVTPRFLPLGLYKTLQISSTGLRNLNSNPAGI